MLLEYCAKCGKKVDDEAMKFGAVRITKDAYWCQDCAKGLAQAPDAPKAPQPRAPRMHTPPQGRPHASGGRNATPAKTSSPVPLIVGISGVLILGVGLFMALRSPEKPPAKTDSAENKPPEKETAKVDQTPPPPPPAKKDEYDPQAATANSFLEQYKKDHVKNPDNVDNYVIQLNELIKRYPNTPAAQEATKITTSPEIAKLTAISLTPDAAWKNAIDLISPVDPAIDAVKGDWTKSGGKLTSSARPPGDCTQITLPYAPPEEYDVRLVFTRKDGRDCAGMRLPFGKYGVTFFIAGYGNLWSGFERIGDKRPPELPFGEKRDNTIKNGERCELVLQLRRNKLVAWLNGKVFVNVPSSYSKQFAPAGDEWESAYPERLSLYTWESVYEFEQLQVLDVSGKGKLLDAATRRGQMQKGLWASFWFHKDEKYFDQRLCARAEPTPNFDIGDNKYGALIPHDNFNIRYGGNLRVDKPGKYRFVLFADDLYELWIDGKSIAKCRHPNEGSGEVELTAGPHAIRIDYTEYGGGAKLQLKWQPPGENGANDVPADVFSYDPTKTKQYEQP